MENNYEKVMSELNFSYNDFEDLVEKILKTKFKRVSHYWDEFRSEAPLVFLNCLKCYKEDKEKGEFRTYLYRSLVMRFLDMYAQFEGGCSRYSVYKNQHRKRVDLEDYPEPVVEDDIFKELEIEEVIEEVNKFLKNLKAEDREIFEYSFGINGKSKKTEIEIATTFNVSRGRIAQIKNDILEQIKKKIN